MQNFDSFVKNKGILHIETDDAQYDDKWKMSIDVSSIWTQYDGKKISLVDFNNNYATILIENQQNISNVVGDACWNEIEPIAVNELREATDLEDSEKIYNKLYDIFDKYEILIETNEKV